MRAIKLIYVIRAIGIAGIINAIRNGFLRDRTDKKYRLKVSNQRTLSPGHITGTKIIRNGIKIAFEHAELEIFFLNQAIVRISWTPGKPPANFMIYENNGEQFSLNINKEDGYQYITSNILKIAISNSGELSFYDLEGKLLKRDFLPAKNGEAWSLSSFLHDEEHIYGLGERAKTFNLRNGSYLSWNTDIGGNYSRGSDPLYIGTPIYLSLSESGCHLVFHENTHKSKFMLGETLDVSFDGGMLRYYVITGSLSQIYSELAKLVGFPTLPPLWSLGYHQCRWGYHNEIDIRNVVRGFEEHNLPLSAIHLDIDYMDKFRVFSINSQRFPSMKKLAGDLSEKGIKVVASINPAVKIDQKYEVYKSGLENDVFCKLPSGELMKGVSWPGWCAFPDFTKAITRDWWKGQYKYLLDEGIAGIWHDMNEPASFAAWGDKTFPLSTTHDMEGKGGDHIEAHNIYGLMMNKAGFEALSQYSPAKRPWIFSRAGWAGLQRYAWNWTGDIGSSWEALRVTIPMIMGLGISGHVFSGVDIGGFSGDPDAELYLRWFQMAAFLPLFRTHSAVGTKQREPWVFGEPTTSIVRKFAQTRYKLLPYLYTLAWKTSRTGVPFIRPIYWANVQDQSLWDIDDEFMLGDNILVIPVVHEAEISRSFVLPPGNWYSFWNDQQINGPCQIDVPTSLEIIPVYIKGGTILPMDDHGTLSLHIFPADDNQSVNQIYLDDGDGYGSSRIDTIQMTSSPEKLHLVWTSQGDYPFPFKEIKFQVHGATLDYLVIDGQPCSIGENSFITAIFKTAELDITR